MIRSLIVKKDWNYNELMGKYIFEKKLVVVHNNGSFSSEWVIMKQWKPEGGEWFKMELDPIMMYYEWDTFETIQRRYQ